MFMVMEFVDGEPLAQDPVPREAPVGEKACEIVLQVAEALHYIHKQNVVHCDIKTENILIGEEQLEAKRSRMVVKLLDFGLARPLTGPRASTSLSGTPHYVAPERIRGEPASPSSDVYGVGILLYELLTGQVPWDGHVAEDPRRPPRREAEAAVAAGRGRARPRAREPRAARAREASDRAPQGHGGVHLRAASTVMDMLGIGKKRAARSRRAASSSSRRPRTARDELARTAFDACRLPLALLTPTGQIVVANPAFAKFVMGVSVEVEGLPVQVDAARVGVVDLRAGPRAHARRQPGAPHHRDRRLGRRDAPPPALARRRVEAITSLLGVQPLEISTSCRRSVSEPSSRRCS